MKGATANQSQSGGFELFNRTQSLIFSVVRMAIIVTAATLLGGYLEKTFGRKAVFKWGIIALLGSVVLLIAMVVLNLVQG
jgi:hypothetical protein